MGRQVRAGAQRALAQTSGVVTATQPELDLFDEPDDPHRAAWQAPATCPSCGVTEPDGWALYRVHDLTPTRRYEPTWPCRAQRRTIQ